MDFPHINVSGQLFDTIVINYVNEYINNLCAKDAFSLLSMVLQCLTIIAFHHGKINISTIKVVLSAGPAFFILNFIECTLSNLFFLISLFL